MPSPVADLLEALSGALEGLDVGWYLFGAQAAVLHGAARLTIDVDVTVQLGEIRSEQLAEALTAAGFDLTFSDPAFIQQTRVLAGSHPPTGLGVDVVLGGPGLEQMFLDRAEIHEVEGIPVPVARATDVIVMKILAARPKDHEDVVSILVAQPDLPLDDVRKTLGLLEEALGQSDLVPAFERDLLAARKR